MAIFSLQMNVRDYECDLQGVVNNAVYLNYLEHTRHEFIKSEGLDFAALHDQGIDPMVSRIEIDYKASLRSGDSFISELSLSRQGKLRLIFHQQLRKDTDDLLIVSADIYTVVLEGGRPVPLGENIGSLLNYL